MERKKEHCAGHTEDILKIANPDEKEKKLELEIIECS